MRIIDFMDTAKVVVETCAKVKPGDRVLIVTDTETSPLIAQALAAAAHSINAVPVIAVVLRLPYPAAEVPDNVAEAIGASEVTIAASSQPITHTKAIQEKVVKLKRRFVSMPGITEYMMVAGGSTVDPRLLEKVTKHVAEELGGRRLFRVTSELGTDAEFSIDGRPVFPNYGVIEGDWGLTMFPDGEVSMAPIEDSVNGTIVIDTYQLGVGPIREPITWTLEGGKVVEISGGLEADVLKGLITRYGDENCYRIGEFAVGTNPEAQVIGSAGEDKKKLGSVHFSLGDNKVMGGKNWSKLHLDGVILKPNLLVDGRLVIEKGELRV